MDDPQRFTSLLAMIGQLSAALVATPAGHVSDRYGRKPLVYCSCLIMAAVYFSFALGPRIEVVLALGVGCTPPAPPSPAPPLTIPPPPRLARPHTRTRTHRRTRPLSLPLSLPLSSVSPPSPSLPPSLASPSLTRAHPFSARVDGIGNGMFLSVDYALACDTLPSLESAAQGLGVWGVSAFLGSTLGPLIAAPLLAYFGWTSSPERYSSTGYTAVNLAGAIYVICAGGFLCFVKRR